MIANSKHLTGQKDIAENIIEIGKNNRFILFITSNFIQYSVMIWKKF